jgi:hypothetical protein
VTGGTEAIADRFQPEWKVPKSFSLLDGRPPRPNQETPPSNALALRAWLHKL